MNPVVFLFGAFASWLLLGASPTVLASPSPSWRAAGQESTVVEPSIREFEQMIRQVAALLTAGHDGQALWLSVSAVSESAVVKRLAERCVALASMGLSASAAFQDFAARFPQGEPLAEASYEVAACLQTAENNGVPLAEVMVRLAEHLEARLDAQSLRQVALAGPRATATLLSWLPALGLAAGYLMGVDPVAVLISTPLGFASLLAGFVLLLAGRFWTAALVRSAGRQP